MHLSQVQRVKTGWVAAFILLVASQVWINHWMGLRPAVSVVDRPIPEKWDPGVVRLLSFGNFPVVVDWILIRAVAEAELNRVNSGSHSNLYYQLDLVSDLDPAYFDVYQIAGDLLTVLQNDGLGSKAILLKGVGYIREHLGHLQGSLKTDYWSRPWKLFVLLAYTYLFHLDDMPHAAEAFMAASSYPDAPDYLGSLERRLKRPGGQYEVGLKLLGFMMSSAKDPRLLEVLDRKRRDLFIAQYLFELNQSFLAYLKMQSFYNTSGIVSKSQMQSYFKEFLRRTQTPQFDPWGGKIIMDEIGRVTSSTPFQKVFGLE